MRILHVITTLDVGGAEQHLLTQVRGADAQAEGQRDQARRDVHEEDPSPAPTLRQPSPERRAAGETQVGHHGQKPECAPARLGGKVFIRIPGEFAKSIAAPRARL